MTVAVLDGDMILHIACSATEQEVSWSPTLTTLYSDPERARDAAEEIIDKWSMPGTPLIAFSDPHRNYFRHSLYPAYKAGRTRKPLNHAPLRVWLEENYETVWRPGLEGDDVIGMLMSHPSGQYVGVSGDKDLRTVPGKLFNPTKDGGVETISLDEANLAHLMQTLVGDTTDGYKGCPGIGRVKAEKILDGHIVEEGAWHDVVEAFEKAGLDEADALLQARMAYILRHGDYNKQTQEVKLWNPR